MSCSICVGHIARRCDCAWCRRWRCFNCERFGGSRGEPERQLLNLLLRRQLQLLVLKALTQVELAASGSNG